MSNKQHQNQATFYTYRTPTHKLTLKERLWSYTELTAEAFAIMVFAFFFFTVFVHFVFK